MWLRRLPSPRSHRRHRRKTFFRTCSEALAAPARRGFKCPTADTKVVYGSSIDGAATENGKPYTKLPNAFRYRDEIVAGCTCNGKDSGGLARIEPENDPTLRKGAIVAGANGLVVASKTSDRRGASVEF